jgi:DNA-binding IclR family transcriptional regulator
MAPDMPVTSNNPKRWQPSFAKQSHKFRIHIMTKPELPEEEPQEKYLVPGLERGLRLLCEFNRHDKTLSAPELARRLNVPRSTVFRLLATLERMGFVERTNGGRDYRLGMAVLRLGFEYLASLELPEIGRPLLDRLRDEIGYNTNLVVRDGRSIVYIAKSTTSSSFVSSVHVGTRLPAHATIFGRVLLQDLSLAELRELYPEDHLEVFSGNTPKTVVELFHMVQHDKERGIVLQEGFFERGISTVAAPVRDRSGAIVAALGATIPAPHIEGSKLDHIVQRVRETANELSRLLDYTPEKLHGKVINL